MIAELNQILIITQLILSLFFSLLFLSLGGNRKANRYIAVLLLLFVFFSLHDSFRQFGGLQHLSYPLYLLSSLALTGIFPLFHFYVGSLYPIGKKNKVLHFIPSLLCLFLLLPGVAGDWPEPSYYQNFQLFQSSDLQKTRWNYFVANDLIFSAQFVFYAVSNIHFIKKIRPKLEESFSSLEGKKLTWIVYLYAILALVFFTYLGIELLTHLPLDRYDLLYYILVLLFLMALIYGVFRQNELFYPEETTLTNSSAPVPIPHELAQTIQQQLNLLIEKEQFHTRRDLTLGQLANSLKTNKNIVSQFLNQNLHQNFYQYINSLRVEEAKKQLRRRDSSRFSIEGIGYMAGFNSKTTFNTVFKAQTGMSPSEFKQQFRIVPVSENHSYDNKNQPE
ncbi:MAG TPA: AraC family transcriptional regulator [Prolixibacteraceae bacterium]|nr:AraC family transcriptional regulator [Prolixibacteraceae bacterium]